MKEKYFRANLYRGKNVKIDSFGSRKKINMKFSIR